MNRASLLAFFVYLCSQSYLFYYLGPFARDIFAMQLTFDIDQFKQILMGWGAREHHLFHRHLILDFINPMTYGAALFVPMLSVARFIPIQRPQIVLWLPAFAVICDWGENLGHWICVSQYPEIDLLYFLSAQLLSLTKWSSISLSLLFLVWGFGLRRSDSLFE